LRILNFGAQLFEKTSCSFVPFVVKKVFAVESNELIQRHTLGIAPAWRPHRGNHFFAMSEKISLIIQAGGKSSRMGQDKALKPFLGRPLIVRVIERLAPIADEILVTTNSPEQYAFLGLRLVPDLVPGCGPLGGLHAGLTAAAHPIVAVVACDMPFASAPLLEAAARLLVQEGADVVIPRSDSGLEPLHAVYRRETCLHNIQEAIQAGEYKLIGWFPKVNVREMTPEEVAALDPSRLAFWNVNTPAEFEQAEKIAAGVR